MTDGQPARFTRFPELEARITLATAITSDFKRETGPAHDGRVDWLAWAHRLSQSLTGLLGGLAASEPDAQARAAFYAAAVAASASWPDGTARLSRSDRMTVLDALRDGIAYRTGRGSTATSEFLVTSYRHVITAIEIIPDA